MKSNFLRTNSFTFRPSQSPKRGLLLWLAGITLCLGAAAATVIGCAWVNTGPSVRFNSFRTEREFGRLPPLPTRADGLTEKKASWYGMVGEEEFEGQSTTEKQSAKESDALWDRAEAAEERGDLTQARRLLSAYLARTATARTSYWGQPKDRQARRNSAIDRLDALAALDQGARASAVQSYLAARRAYDSLGPAGGIRADSQHTPGSGLTLGEAQGLLAAVSPEPHLRDNVAYLKAALLYQEGRRTGQDDEAIRAFTALAASYPHSEKREAALFMAALITMKQSSSFTGTSGDAAHLAADRRPGNADEADSSPQVDCCDQAWHTAHDGFLRVMREYPHGRYYSDARGWLAYLYLRSGDHAQALVEYYRLLGNEHNLNGRLEAAFSLTLVRHHASDEEMRRVEAELTDEPAAALAYAYHNIYNYAIDPGCPLTDYYGGNESETKRLEEARLATGRAEMARVAAFATRLMRRYPHTAVSGGFALRVAQADLELGNNSAALGLARRAIALGVKGDERSQALWVKGVAEHRLRDYASARRTLSALIAADPHGRLTEGARRLLAMAAEDAGDIDTALEQYLALDYKDDVAYFIDVLMTPEQLAGFIERHPNSDKHDELLYALGVRYLREWRWPEARAAFGRVRTIGRGEWYSFRHSKPPLGVKEYWGDDHSEDGVRPWWIMRDLQTINDLEQLQRGIEQGQGDEAKAEALYQLASYVYEERELLFYNPAAWGGRRYWNLSDLALQNKFRTPGEAQVLWDYMQSHDYPARALSIYLEIVRRFPHTRAARDALYTAAVCHERLSNFNPYWSHVYELGLHAGERQVTYDDVKVTYPKYQLPRGTWGWKPSTRTVNGSPAWVAPPKPRPRPTWRARVKHKFTAWRDRAATMMNAGVETGRRWLIIGLSTLCVLCAGYYALTAAYVKRQHRAPSPCQELIAALHEGAQATDPESRVERVINQQ